MKFRCALILAGVLAAPSLLADSADKLAELVGYTIVDVKTIEGYIDDDGKRSDEFEGCDFDRRIVFTDNSTLTCATFNFTYSFLPKAVILVKKIDTKDVRGTMIKMVVGDDIYDMQPVVER